MDLKWTSKALSDLARLYEFLAPVYQLPEYRLFAEDFCLFSPPCRVPGYTPCYPS
jgi:hypothetical protein